MEIYFSNPKLNNAHLQIALKWYNKWFVLTIVFAFQSSWVIACGGLWWSLVVFGGLWWSLVVFGGLWWSVVVGYGRKKTINVSALSARILTCINIMHYRVHTMNIHL